MEMLSEMEDTLELIYFTFLIIQSNKGRHREIEEFTQVHLVIN